MSSLGRFYQLSKQVEERQQQREQELRNARNQGPQSQASTSRVAKTTNMIPVFATPRNNTTGYCPSHATDQTLANVQAAAMYSLQGQPPHQLHFVDPRSTQARAHGQATATPAVPTYPSSADEVAHRVIRELMPSIQQIQLQQTSFITKTEQTLGNLVGIVNAVDQKISKHENFLESLTKNEDKQVSALKILAQEMKGFKKALGKSIDGDDGRTVLGRLDAVTFAVGELLERARDPEANLPDTQVAGCRSNVITLDHDDVSAVSAPIQVLPAVQRPVVRHEIGTSPISRVYADAAVGISPSPSLLPTPSPSPRVCDISCTSIAVTTSPQRQSHANPSPLQDADETVSEKQVSSSSSPDLELAPQLRRRSSAQTLVGDFSIADTAILSSLDTTKVSFSPLTLQADAFDKAVDLQPGVDTDAKMDVDQVLGMLHPNDFGQLGESDQQQHTPCQVDEHNSGHKPSTIVTATRSGRVANAFSPVDWSSTARSPRGRMTRSGNTSNSGSVMSALGPRPQSPLPFLQSPNSISASLPQRLQKSYTLPLPAEGTVASLRHAALGNDPFAYGGGVDIGVEQTPEPYHSCPEVTAPMGSPPESGSEGDIESFKTLPESSPDRVRGQAVTVTSSTTAASSLGCSLSVLADPAASPTPAVTSSPQNADQGNWEVPPASQTTNASNASDEAYVHGMVTLVEQQANQDEQQETVDETELQEEDDAISSFSSLGPGHDYEQVDTQSMSTIRDINSSIQVANFSHSQSLSRLSSIAPSAVSSYQPPVGPPSVTVSVSAVDKLTSAARAALAFLSPTVNLTPPRVTATDQEGEEAMSASSCSPPQMEDDGTESAVDELLPSSPPAFEYPDQRQDQGQAQVSDYQAPSPPPFISPSRRRPLRYEDDDDDDRLPSASAIQTSTPKPMSKLKKHEFLSPFTISDSSSPQKETNSAVRKRILEKGKARQRSKPLSVIVISSDDEDSLLPLKVNRLVKSAVEGPPAKASTSATSLVSTAAPEKQSVAGTEEPAERTATDLIVELLIKPLSPISDLTDEDDTTKPATNEKHKGKATPRVSISKEKNKNKKDPPKDRQADQSLGWHLYGAAEDGAEIVRANKRRKVSGNEASTRTGHGGDQGTEPIQGPSFTTKSTKSVAAAGAQAKVAEVAKGLTLPLRNPKRFNFRTGPKAPSAAITRIKKRKVVPDVFRGAREDSEDDIDPEPPLKRVRQRVSDTSKAVQAKDIKSNGGLSSSPKRGKTRSSTGTTKSSPLKPKTKESTTIQRKVQEELSQPKTSMTGKPRGPKVKVYWPEVAVGNKAFYKEFVKCDICMAWYHYGCVGIVLGDVLVQDDEIYTCPPCVGQVPPSVLVNFHMFFC
ncbi:hypothetical protein B0H34DRAFT_505020 [Crassisporium funariophilum]|nr:hypothetical protein B0H34DRAFT_505020 [Crassisporium funariophilum]